LSIGSCREHIVIRDNIIKQYKYLTLFSFLQISQKNILRENCLYSAVRFGMASRN
jgi:hypothetical protein